MAQVETALFHTICYTELKETLALLTSEFTVFSSEGFCADANIVIRFVQRLARSSILTRKTLTGTLNLKYKETLLISLTLLK